MAFGDDHPLSPAAMGGHLVQLVGERDGAALAHEVSLLSLSGTDRPRYEDVLTWVMESIAEAVQARLGAAPPGENFVLEIRRTDGRELVPGDLPTSGQWVLRTAAALLADAPAEAAYQLAEAGRESDPVRRAETLADAAIWLDFLLDVDLPDPPNVPTGE